MKAGFKVETRMCGFGDTVLVVTNYKFSNLVINYPMISYTQNNRGPEDVGMWKVKQLKN
jgi:hypothetical protein